MSIFAAIRHAGFPVFGMCMSIEWGHWHSITTGVQALLLFRHIWIGVDIPW